eukprot:m51a1_g7961 hypothetical protein (329) ;mRNA; r:226672-227780
MTQLTPSSVITALLLLGCAAHASTCDQKRHADVGEFCGHGADGLYVCDPLTSYCNNQSASVSDWRCAPLVATGGNCTASEQCARHWEDGYCEKNRCKLKWVRLGESCTTDYTCMSNYCKNGVCGVPDYKTIGSACHSRGNLDDCSPGLVCRESVCTVPKPNGTACTDSEECRAKQCTDAHFCIDPYVQPVGGPCTSNTDCALGLCCAVGFAAKEYSLGVCLEPPPEMHIPCKGDSDCETAGRPGAYSCECDVKNKGWFCKRKWTMPDYTISKCEDTKGWGACEDLWIKALMDNAKAEAYYMWMGDSGSANRVALPAAVLVALSFAQPL